MFSQVIFDPRHFDSAVVSFDEFAIVVSRHGSIVVLGGISYNSLIRVIKRFTDILTKGGFRIGRYKVKIYQMDNAFYSDC
jgi:TATA-box binding protein (TBP) (component of TFIID and TFIIIB)